jgi:hypothetical protein
MIEGRNGEQIWTFNYLVKSEPYTFFKHECSSFNYITQAGSVWVFLFFKSFSKEMLKLLLLERNFLIF